MSIFQGQGISNSGSGNFSVAGNVNIGAQDRSEQDNRFLADLRSTDPRDDKARIERTKGGLLRDSYRWILEHEDFCRWRDTEQNRLLWIKGDPGKGKTMLLCGIIDELQKLPKLPTGTPVLSYFFCQATDARLNNATAVLRGLIYQLLDQDVSLISRVRRKYDHTGTKLFKDVNSWDALSKILTSILEDPSLQHAYLIIDALDECETNLSPLLHLIIQVSSTSRTKMIISSRNRPDIENIIRPTESQTRLGLELKENAEQISYAVDIYITQCVSQLTQLQGDTFLQEQVRHTMQLKADRTFLWVALVMQELRDAQEWEVIDILSEVPAGLNDLYQRMLIQIQRLPRKNPDFCRDILSTVTTAYRPLHLDELQALTDLPSGISNKDENFIKIITLCGSFLTIRNGVIYLVHQSARDFLTLDKYLFPSGLALAHDQIASRSLQVMSRTLRRDIYNLKAPGFPVDKIKTPNPDPLAPARYSCVYWVHHFAARDDSKQKHRRESLLDGGPTHTFLMQHYLHWLEALSLLGGMSAGILQMSTLMHLAQELIGASQLKKLIWDGLRFLRTHRAGIESSPLQTYVSALIFSPTRSIIRALFVHEEPPWILIKPAMEEEWNACLQTLEGHYGQINSVAFSNDDTQLASASSDKTIKIWDSATGQCLRTLKGHRGEVNSVAFLSDSTQIASASVDKAIKIWDRITGQCLRTIEGHSGSVYSVAFSGDNSQLASVSSDKTIKIWDMATGQCLRTIEGHSYSVVSVAFSSNSTQLASASDETIKIWDSTTGQCLQTLESQFFYINKVRSVSFSSDGTQLASGCYGAIEIWDSTTGQCLRMLRGHRGEVNSVAFSSDSTQLASASSDTTIKIWNRDTGQCLQTLKGHRKEVDSVAFSSDGTHLASASRDMTIMIWDRSINQSLSRIEGHNDGVGLLAFSIDGTQLASASDDETIKIWNKATGRCIRTLKGHRGGVNSVAFSSDDTQLASASVDKTIKIWDKATGRCIRTLKGHRGEVNSVAFSSDDTQLTSASNDETIKIWNKATGQCLRTLSIRRSIRNISFSKGTSQLQTEIGTIDLEKVSTSGSLVLLPLAIADENTPSFQYAISASGMWITRDSVNVLWIPPEYRSVKSAAERSTIAIGTNTGRVLFFRFSQDIN